MGSETSASLPPLPAVQRYFEVSLYLLVATGILAVVSTGKLDPISIVLPPIVLIYKGIRVSRGRGPELSPRLATWLVLAYFLFFPLDLWVLSRSLAEGAPNPTLYAALLAAIHLMLFAVIVRLLSARTSRDFGFLAVLAFTCMLASAILTVEAGFLIALAIFLVLAVSTFVALEMQRSAAGAVSPPVEAGSPLAEQLNQALGLTSILVAVGALIIGAVLFFLIPRFTAGYMSALNLQSGLATGFTDNVSLGEIGKIKKNSAVVMRIKIEGDPVRAEDVHWRGIVLTNFDGRRWFTPEQKMEVLNPSVEGTYDFEVKALPPGKSFVLRYTALVEPLGTDAIFVASRPESLRGRFSTAGGRGLGTTRSQFLFVDRTGSIFNPAHNETKTRYQGVSELPIIPPSELREAGSEFPEQILAEYLQLPELDPRVKALAGQITSKAKNEYDKATAIENYLKTHYSYTLDLSGPRVADPLANFLFGRRSGNCEYFASAMTVMARVEGIPARYVTGFLPGEFNDVGRDYIVRSSDAHTWVEIYFPGYGWMTFDPTPPGNDAHNGLLARIALYWDWFQYTWSEWVINYDFGHQVSLAQNLQKSSRAWGEGAQRYLREKQEQIMRFLLALDRHVEASRATLPFLLVLLTGLLIYRRRRSVIEYVFARWTVRVRRSGNLTASLAALEYREMLRLLEKRGWRKVPSETPAEFASTISGPDLAILVVRLTELYQNVRFGGHPTGAKEMASLLGSIRELLRNQRRIPETSG